MDNDSGVSALIKIANGLQEKAKQKPFDEDIIFCAFNGEEEATAGSHAFVEQITSQYIIYSIDINFLLGKLY